MSNVAKLPSVYLLSGASSAAPRTLTIVAPLAKGRRDAPIAGAGGDVKPRARTAKSGSTDHRARRLSTSPRRADSHAYGT